MPENIEPINISSETQRRYLNYAISVIQSRALPDVRDGLKPVQRRILYAMWMEGYRADGRTRKCTGVVGEVCKSYHPHGTAPVYEALVRMAQNFTLRTPLVHGEGNFGSVDGDPPAAERYTECRLMPVAEEMMQELGQQTVDFRPNFDGEKMEPIVLPARFPNLLANGAAGIAVGMATNIPPHNLGELLKACLLLIDHDGAEPVGVNQLVNIARGPIKGPDFPLGGRLVTDQKTLRQIYETGQGTLRVQGEWKLEQPSGKRDSKALPQIVISSIPYGIEKGKLLQEIGDVISSKRLPLAVDMVDESSLANGMRIVIELKEGTDHEAVMAYLFKHTNLQDTFACNFTCLVPTHPVERPAAGEERAAVELQPRRIGLVEMLQQFLDFRLETLRRRYEHALAQLLRRIHILEGLRIIFNALDEALSLIRASNGRQNAAERLRGAFALDEEQSLAIVDLNLYRIGQLEVDKILTELREKRRDAAQIQELLSSESALWGEVRKELVEFSEKYAEKRKTRIADEEASPEFNEEAYIVRENANIVLTRDGWVKRVGRLQSVATTRVRDGDEVLAVLPGSTHDFVIFLSSDGFAYTIRIDEIPASSGYGEPITKYFRLRDGVSIVAMLTTDPRFTPIGSPIVGKKAPFFDGAEEWQLVVGTSAGQVNRLPLSAFMAESTKAGRRFIRMGEGETVMLATTPTAEQESMFLVADDGHVLHFPIAEIPLLAGVGKGVRGIKLEPKARCLGGALIGGFRDVMRVETPKGTVHECRRGKYEPVARGNKGYEVARRGGLKRIIPEEIQLVDWSQIDT